MTAEAGRRRQHRVTVDIPVGFSFAGHQFHGTAKNLSVGGMFIETRGSLPFSAEILLMFTVPHPRQIVVVQAQVRWIEGQNGTAAGIGVQFLGLRAKHVWALNKYLADKHLAA